MENLFSIPFFAIILGLLAANQFFLERYRKVIDSIKQESIHQKVKPALKTLIEDLIDKVQASETGESETDKFIVNLKDELEQINSIKLETLNQKIFEATELLRKAETLFDRYLHMTTRTIIFSFILAVATFLPFLSKWFVQQYLTEYMDLFARTYYVLFSIVFLLWINYFFRCIMSVCHLSKLWKDYV